MKAPPRLLEDPAIAPELRDDLRRATENAPVAYDAAAGLASLHAAIGSAPVPIAPGHGGAAHAGAAHAGTAAATGATTAAAGISAAKMALIALGASAAIATGVATWPSAHRAEHSAPPPAASAITTPRAVPPAQPALLPQVPEGTPAVVPSPAVVPAPAVVPKRALTPERAETSGRAEVDGDAALRSEVAQLRAIKARLERDPAQAYRLALAGQRKWKNGVLAQEREGLMVLALWALERRDEARTEARAFLDRYPSSPLRERLQPILGGTSP